MRRLLVWCSGVTVVLLAILTAVPGLALQADAAAGDGYIEQYDVGITINDDGSLDGR